MTYKLTGQEPYQIPTNADLGTLAYQNADALQVGLVNVSNTLTVSGVIAPLTIGYSQSAAGTYLALTQVPSNIAVGGLVSGSNITAGTTVTSFVTGFSTYQPTYTGTTATTVIAMTSTYGISASMAVGGTGITYGTSVSSISNTAVPVTYQVTSATTAGTTIWIGTTTNVAVGSMVFGTGVNNTNTLVTVISANTYVTVNQAVTTTLGQNVIFAPTVTLSAAITANTLTQNLLFFPTITLNQATSAALTQGSVFNTYYASSTVSNAALVITAGGIGVTGNSYFANGVYANTFYGNFSGAITTASNLAAGTAGQIVYQSAPGATAFVGPGSYGQFLMSTGASAPVYQSTLTQVNGNIIITSNTPASNTTTGALQIVNGGAGIGGGLVVGGISTITNTATAISTTTGALQVVGGAGIGGNLFVGGVFTITNTSGGGSATGALQVTAGGAYIYGLIYTMGGVTAPGGDFSGRSAILTGSSSISSTASVSSTNTGALQVTGGVGIGGGLVVGGTVTATSFVGTFAGSVAGVSSTATNIQNGTAGAIPYQSAPGVTAFAAISTAGYVLQSSGAIPRWVDIGPTVLNDISSQFDGSKTVFNLRLDQNIINTIVDSKDLEVVIGGQRLAPYIDTLTYPWLTPYDSFKGFRVKSSTSTGQIVIYNAPYRGDRAVLTLRQQTITRQKRKYPYSATSIAFGD